MGVSPSIFLYTWMSHTNTRSKLKAQIVFEKERIQVSGRRLLCYNELVGFVLRLRDWCSTAEVCDCSGGLFCGKASPRNWKGSCSLRDLLFHVGKGVWARKERRLSAKLLGPFVKENWAWMQESLSGIEACFIDCSCTGTTGLRKAFWSICAWKVPFGTGAIDMTTGILEEQRIVSLPQDSSGSSPPNAGRQKKK